MLMAFVCRLLIAACATQARLRPMDDGVVHSLDEVASAMLQRTLVPQKDKALSSNGFRRQTLDCTLRDTSKGMTKRMIALYSCEGL